MKHYLRYLCELYLDYMKLALSGAVVSAILLSFHSLVATRDAFKIVLVVVFLGIVGLVTLWWRRHIATNKEERQPELRGLQRREDEALAERAMNRMEEARQYLKLTQTRGIKDYGPSSEEASLVNDMALIIERLQIEHVSQPSIEEALDRFLSILDERNEGLVPDARQRILNSIVSDIVMSENTRKQESKRFIS